MKKYILLLFIITNICFTQNNFNKREDPDYENWDIDKLDVAANLDYLSGVEKDVILEINKVRTNPKKYAELYLRPRLKYFDGKRYSVPGQTTIVTKEGVSAVNECIAELNRTKSVDILTPEKGLYLAAKDHVIDQSKTGQTGHYGNDGSEPRTRMERYGTCEGWSGENIGYGRDTGRDIVCGLIVDDGVSSRGHRKIIMSNNYTQLGVAYGTHTGYRTMCVINYASDYQTKAKYDESVKYNGTKNSNSSRTVKYYIDQADSFDDSDDNYDQRVRYYNKALEVCNKGIKSNPNNAENYYWRGRANSGLENDKEALRDFNKAIELNPDYAKAYYEKGKATYELYTHSASKDIDGAIKDLTKAIDLGYNEMDIYMCRANAYDSRGYTKKYQRKDIQGASSDYRNAAKDYDMVIRISPNSREADLSRHRSAMSKLEAGDYEDAIKDYTNILKRNPNGSNGLTYNERGQAYEGLGDLDAACADYKRAGSSGSEGRERLREKYKYNCR